MKSKTGKLPTGEFNPFGDTGESCNHKWIHLRTYKSYHVNTATSQREYYVTDRFYCENCCEIKEITKCL